MAWRLVGVVMSGPSYHMPFDSFNAVVCSSTCCSLVYLIYLTLGEMLLHLDSLNSRLCSVAVSCSPSLRAPASDSTPFGCYDYLSIYHPEEHTAMMELLAAVEKGHMTVM